MTKSRSLEIEETIIHIPGFAQNLELLQITDAHLTEAYETELSEIQEASQNRTPVFHGHTNESPAPTTVELFHRLMDYGIAQNSDAVIMSGDIIDFPSQANLDLVEQRVKQLNCPYLYTMGNHDWHFWHQANSEETRNLNYAKFKNLCSGTPAYASLEIQGLKVVTLDNSKYQLSPDQVEFFMSEMAEGKPTLLFIHIPIYIKSLSPAVIQDWKAPIMMAAKGWQESMMKSWKVSETEPSTKAFYDFVTESSEAQNLHGIFSGHLHFGHQDAYRQDRFQYVTEPGYKGRARQIKISGYL